jgi:hypothetical protein
LFFVPLLSSLEVFTESKGYGIVYSTNHRGDSVMAFHKNHVVRFLAAAGLGPNQDKAVLERVDDAIEAFSNKDKGMFSAGKLDEVIGNPELVTKFNDMWEAGQLH